MKKKHWHLAPKCLCHLELGPTKMCDSCEQSLARNDTSAECPRCGARYHPECLLFFSRERELFWQVPRCRKCHEALDEAPLGEFVKTPAMRTLALADGMLGGANYLESGAIKRNLVENQTVRLNMLTTHLESGTATATLAGEESGGRATRAFAQTPPPPDLGTMS